MRLGNVRSGQVVVADGVSYRDVEVLALGLLDAEEAGRAFVYRTAASFYRARGGQGPRALLTSSNASSGESPRIISRQAAIIPERPTPARQ